MPQRVHDMNLRKTEKVLAYLTSAMGVGQGRLQRCKEEADNLTRESAVHNGVE